MDRIKELVKILNEASKAYYQENREIMSDFKYDSLYDELERLEKETGIVLSNSPTQKVGYTVLKGLKKVKHETKMLSLDKTKSIEKLETFLLNGRGIVSWKMDGLTVALTYEKGKLKRAVTRGNGESGEDITHNAIVFKNIPLEINCDEDVTVRGEAVITFSDFDKINESIENEEKYKNPRNLCSGTVRQLNSEITAGRNVMFYGFSVICKNIEFDDKKEEQLLWLKKQGFDVVQYKIATEKNIGEIVEYFKNNVVKNDFATDGLVVTYDSISYSNSLGNTSKFPRDAIAFKWADDLAETKLIEIKWNTSRTGLINPIAIFEPVDLGGTTVNRASLHNVSILESLELGEGDVITVYKANMIIPQIGENLTRSNTAHIPKECPVCHHKAEMISQNEGKFLYCSNASCKAQLIRSLSHFVSRDAMNIEGLSSATLEKFVEKGFLENYVDIFDLRKYKDEIVNMEGFGTRSFVKLMDSIDNSKECELYNFIYSLSINHIGLSNAKLLCKYYKNDLYKIINATSEELIEIDGFGQVIGNSLFNYFRDKNNMELLEKVLKLITFIKEDINEKELKLENITFVITGDVNIYKNRKELQAYIEDLGGKVTGSVTKKTNYLINNDLNSTSSKNKKAMELGVKIINEEQFNELLQTP